MAWKINDCATEKKGYIRITDEAGKNVADLFPFGAVGGLGREACLENARKIIHAAQLYDALRGLLDWCEEGCPDGGRYSMTEAKAALSAIRMER